jgi:hypothetical protein
MTVAAAVLLSLVVSAPAWAKIVCPPGRFTVQGPALLADVQLELGQGSVALAGLCDPVPAPGFHPLLGRWTRVRARWRRCAGGRGASLRLRFDPVRGHCTHLQGKLRLGRRRIALTAIRIPECGNGLREAGEECDGGAAGSDPCCGAGCRVQAGCPVASYRNPCTLAQARMAPAYTGACL